MRKALFLLLTLLVTACEYESLRPNAVVYIGGFEQDFVSGKTLSIAKYWKDGQEFTVTDGSKFVYINGMTVQGSDVYLVGYQRIIGTPNIAMYWKNGEGVALSDGSMSTKATCITVSGNDVYVGGYDINSNGKCWKNGVPVFATAPWGYMNCITVSGSDVYCAGGSQVWKNGIMVSRVSGTISSMVINNGDIFVCGSAYEGVTFSFAAAYWKNGVVTQLGGIKSNASSIFVSGNDVYVAGNDNDGLVLGYSSFLTPLACYWKNGQRVLLNQGTNGGAQSIEIDGKDIHVIGYSDLGPTYWKNSSATHIGAPNDSTKSVILVSISVAH